MERFIIRYLIFLTVTSWVVHFNSIPSCYGEIAGSEMSSSAGDGGDGEILSDLDPAEDSWDGFEDGTLLAKKKCRCSSGCGLITKGLSPKMTIYLREARAIGVRPISCLRTKKCQNRLRRCFERCGQRGRAARKSKHSAGRACDFKRRDEKKLKSLRIKFGMRQISHSRKKGGGIHHDH